MNPIKASLADNSALLNGHAEGALRVAYAAEAGSLSNEGIDKLPSPTFPDRVNYADRAGIAEGLTEAVWDQIRNLLDSGGEANPVFGGTITYAPAFCVDKGNTGALGYDYVMVVYKAPSTPAGKWLVLPMVPEISAESEFHNTTLPGDNADPLLYVTTTATYKDNFGKYLVDSKNFVVSSGAIISEPFEIAGEKEFQFGTTHESGYDVSGVNVGEQITSLNRISNDQVTGTHDFTGYRYVCLYLGE
jgi:hypothetical protein